MAKNGESPRVLSVARCKRIIRPLLSKIHALTDLYTKYPSKFTFDIQAFYASGSIDRQAFVNPQNAHDRLLHLKPYISLEVYDSYVEIFNIFRNIVTTLYPQVCTERPHKRPKTRDAKEWNHDLAFSRSKLPTLAFLAAEKVGKSVALGTKSTYYSLNQAALFDQESIPPYLKKYQSDLADDIEPWLLMEPSAVMLTHRSGLLLGYIIHILVLNSNTLLFTLVPVLCHWLHEQKLACSRTLFSEFWTHSERDPDHQDIWELTVPTSKADTISQTFWFFYDVGYWQQVTDLIRIRSASGGMDADDHFGALLLNTLGTTDKLALEYVKSADSIYALMTKHSQHPQNTCILISIITQIIKAFKKEYSSATTSLTAYYTFRDAYNSTKTFLQNWLSFNHDCIFNSLDIGNDAIFDACSNFLEHLRSKCGQILEYFRSFEPCQTRKVRAMLENFQFLQVQIDRLWSTCEILKAFYLEVDLGLTRKPFSDKSLAEFMCEMFLRKSDEIIVDEFLSWMLRQGWTENFVSSLWSCFVPLTLSGTRK